MRVCKGSAPELVKDLVGPVPEKWPVGGWKELIEDKFAHTLSVQGHMYKKLMETYPDGLESMVVHGDTALASYIAACLASVRFLRWKAMCIIPKYCSFSTGVMLSML